MPARLPQSNSAGLEKTLKALKARLNPEDQALIAASRNLARAVDDEPHNAALWKEYRAAVAALMEAGADVADDDTAEFLSVVRTPVRAEMGNAS